MLFAGTLITTTKIIAEDSVMHLTYPDLIFSAVVTVLHIPNDMEYSMYVPHIRLPRVGSIA